MCKQLAKALLVGLVVCWPVLAAAQGITIPNTFTNDTVADADQVNANFNALAANALNRAAGVLSGTATPATDNTTDFGSLALRFKDVYAATYHGSGAALTGIASMPTGAIVMFNAASCPASYTEFTDARGRYIVGLVAGGTLDTGVGSALTNQENRAVGQHAHTLTMDPHGHSITDPGHTHSYFGTSWTTAGTAGASEAGNFSSPALTSGSTTTGITINNTTATGTIANSGSVAGTNAPYLQLLLCQKS